MRIACAAARARGGVLGIILHATVVAASATSGVASAQDCPYGFDVATQRCRAKPPSRATVRFKTNTAQSATVMRLKRSPAQALKPGEEASWQLALAGCGPD